jgi:hypothetical protein
LPPRKQAAIQRLGFGCLNKVMLLFPHCFWGDTRVSLLHPDEQQPASVLASTSLDTVCCSSLTASGGQGVSTHTGWGVEHNPTSSIRSAKVSGNFPCQLARTADQPVCCP